MNPPIHSTINHVKQTTDPVEVYRRYLGPETKRTGKNLLWPCPFHQEKTPSFTTTEDQNSPHYGRFKCFGCGKSGDFLDFVQEVSNMDLPETLKELGGVLDLSSITSEEHRERLAQIKAQQEQARKEAEEKRLTEEAGALERVSGMAGKVDWYYSQGNRDYWYSQGLIDSTIDRFRLGFSPACPILYPDEPRVSSHVIPAYEAGNLISIRHRLHHSPEDQKRWGKYRPEFKGLPPVLFNADSLLPDNWQDFNSLQPGEGILVEGEVKAIALDQWLSSPVAGIPGANNWRGEWIQKFQHLSKIFIVFDPDEAGDRAAARIGRELVDNGFKVVIASSPCKADDWFLYGGTEPGFVKMIYRGRELR